jgi:hypothetical protein
VLQSPKILMLAAALFLSACGFARDVQQAGNEAGTAAAVVQGTAAVLGPTLQAGADSLQQTAAVLAPTLQAQAPEIRQTLEALAPTLQAQAPEIRQTLEAFATDQPVDGVSVRQTLDALTGGTGGQFADDIPLPAERRTLLSTPDHIIYTTSQGYGAVTELYQADMPKQGWEPLPDSTTSDQASALRFQKGSRTANVVIAKMAEGTTVDITIVDDR